MGDWKDLDEKIEEVDEETLKALEKDIKDMIEGKVKTISGDEAVKRLSKLLKKDIEEVEE